jgi:hypothetical protein
MHTSGLVQREPWNRDMSAIQRAIADSAISTAFRGQILEENVLVHLEAPCTEVSNLGTWASGASPFPSAQDIDLSLHFTCASSQMSLERELARFIYRMDPPAVVHTTDEKGIPLVRWAAQEASLMGNEALGPDSFLQVALHGNVVARQVDILTSLRICRSYCCLLAAVSVVDSAGEPGPDIAVHIICIRGVVESGLHSYVDSYHRALCPSRRLMACHRMQDRHPPTIRSSIMWTTRPRCSCVRAEEPFSQTSAAI